MRLALGSDKSIRALSAARSTGADTSKVLSASNQVTTANGVRWPASATRALPSERSW